jgi:hypothetical protein
MARRSYLLVPEELQPFAERVGDYFEVRGYSVKTEPRDILALPLTPTFICQRDKTTLIVEVDSVVPTSVIEQWTGYGRSSKVDTRLGIALLVPDGLGGETI